MQPRHFMWKLVVIMQSVGIGTYGSIHAKTLQPDIMAGSIFAIYAGLICESNVLTMIIP